MTAKQCPACLLLQTRTATQCECGVRFPDALQVAFYDGERRALAKRRALGLHKVKGGLVALGTGVLVYQIAPTFDRMWLVLFAIAVIATSSGALLLGHVAKRSRQIAQALRPVPPDPLPIARALR